MRLKSITTRMVLASILLVAMATLFFSHIFLVQLKQALVADFVRQGESLTENLALNAELGLLLEDKESIEELGKNLLQENTVTQVRIRDHEDHMVVDLKKEKSEGKEQQLFASNVVLSRPKDELSVFRSGLGKTEDALLGKVEVVFSQQRLREILRKMRWRIYTFALFGLLAGGLIAFYLSRIILKPIKTLVQASKAIAEGNWDMRVEESGDDELGQLTRDFNRMAASLVTKRKELGETYRELARQERMAEIGRFSTVVAHEMKNPLGIIRGALQIMAKNGTPEETKRTMAEYIDEEVSRLNQLAEEFLVFARPTPPAFEPVNLAETFQKLIALTETRNGGKGIMLRLDPPVEGNSVVMGDKNQLFQAFLNLVENGLQSSPEGGEVIIGLKSDEKEIRVAISDNGPGVREEDRDRVFEPFFTRKEKGTGLGLAIVRRIVDLHNGRISIGASESGGACFTVWLPKDQEATRKP